MQRHAQLRNESASWIHSTQYPCASTASWNFITLSTFWHWLRCDGSIDISRLYRTKDLGSNFQFSHVIKVSVFRVGGERVRWISLSVATRYSFRLSLLFTLILTICSIGEMPQFHNHMSIFILGKCVRFVFWQMHRIKIQIEMWVLRAMSHSLRGRHYCCRNVAASKNFDIRQKP